MSIKGLGRSSFAEARSKLSWEIFPFLLEKIKCEPEQWKRHNVRAVDGTKVLLPHNSEIIKCFPIQHKHFGEIYYPQATLIAASDIFSGQITDVITGNKHLSEPAALSDMLNVFKKEDISLLDQQFSRKSVWFNFKNSEQYFLCQLKIRGLGVIKEFDSTKKENVVEIKKLKSGETMLVRIIKGPRLKTGSYLYLVTNLINNKKYKRKELLDLYSRRQVVESSFEHLKNRLNLSPCLRVKKLNNLLQEIYAAV